MWISEVVGQPYPMAACEIESVSLGVSLLERMNAKSHFFFFVNKVQISAWGLLLLSHFLR